MSIDRSACRGDQHGTANAYRNHNCRCADAAADNSRYRKLRNAGLAVPGYVDSIGVVRRRQALAAIGYGLPDLAPYFGTTWRAVGMQTGRSRVTRVTWERWRRVYDLLSMTPGPNAAARREAQRRGWPPPLAWDDDIDDPDARPNLGDRRARTAAELATEARFLLAFGLPLRSVAKRLAVSESWVKQLLGGGKRAAA